MFGIPYLFLTQSKSLLLLLNLIWTLLSPCLNYTELSAEQKLDELQVQLTYQWKLFGSSIKGILLSHYNNCLLTGTAPDHWKLSKVVMIYKGNQKNSRAPSSY